MSEFDLLQFPTTFAADRRGLLSELRTAAPHRAVADAAATARGLPVCVLAGIASRESAWGLMLRPPGPGGTGDFTPRKGRVPPDGGGFGRGIMQIDYDAHSFARGAAWPNPAANIAYGALVLAQNVAYLRKALGLVGHELLHAALAGYNCGAENVVRALRKGLDADYYTSGRDYGRDVLDRAGWFLAAGWGAAAVAVPVDPADLDERERDALLAQVAVVARGEIDELEAGAPGGPTGEPPDAA